MLLQKATASKYSFRNATSKCHCASTASTVVPKYIYGYIYTLVVLQLDHTFADTFSSRVRTRL